MENRELLKVGFESSQGVLAQVMADCAGEALTGTVADATIGSIADIYSHLVLSQDFFIHMTTGQPLVFAEGGWGAKIGAEASGPRYSPEQLASLNWPAFVEYSQAVFAATSARLDAVSDADLAKVIDTPLGKQPGAVFLSAIGLHHIAEHTGEIAALKGVRGMKGLPF